MSFVATVSGGLLRPLGSHRPFLHSAERGCIVRIAIARDGPPQAALIVQTFRVARPALRNLLLCFVPLRCGCRSDVPLSRAR